MRERLRDDDATGATTELSYDGNTYAVTVSEEQAAEWTVGDWTAQTDTVNRLEKAAHVTYTHTITAPEDYDGLCFAFDNRTIEWDDAGDDPDFRRNS